MHLDTSDVFEVTQGLRDANGMPFRLLTESTNSLTSLGHGVFTQTTQGAISKKTLNHGVFCRRLTQTPLPTNFPSLENAIERHDIYVLSLFVFLKSGSFEAIKP